MRGFIRFLSTIYRDLGFAELRHQVLDRPTCAWAPTRSGTRPKRAGKAAIRAAGIELRAEPRRRRVLRPQARIRADRRDRARLAMRHLPGGFRAARAARRHLHRPGWRETPPRHAAPRDPRLLRALHRHPDREHAGKLPFWLAPRQVVVASIVSEADDFVHEAVAALKGRGPGRGRHRATRRSTTRSASIPWARCR
jgi:threonyl-tRNA synthetase